jgi:AraC-like DNA-binding protein
MTQSQHSWREVPVELLGLGPREYLRFGAAVMWVFDPRSLAGCSARVDGGTDIEAMIPALIALSRNLPNPVDFLSDMRHGEGTDPAMVKATGANFPAVAPMLARVFARQSGILPRDWSAPYWKALNQHNNVPWPTETAFEATEAWAWLGTDAAIVAEVERFIADAMSATDRAEVLRATLRAKPRLSLTECAREMGVSARSLQRLLETSGQSFSDVRGQVRLRHAESLLADGTLKVEAIATACGFGSVSHFASWFRRLRGVTPSQFRDPR